MSNWYYDEPGDALATFNRRVVCTEDMIVHEHRGFFIKDTAMGHELEQADELFVYETVIEDWVICNWASRTDMPAGEYLTSNRS